jgi:hypothetical protein
LFVDRGAETAHQTFDARTPIGPFLPGELQLSLQALLCTLLVLYAIEEQHCRDAGGNDQGNLYELEAELEKIDFFFVDDFQHEQKQDCGAGQRRRFPATQSR